MNTGTTMACGIAAAFLAFPVARAESPAGNMSFFITSEGSGDGAKLGGLEGADALCAMLAADAGSAKKDWRAYLSTQDRDGSDGVDARDRIGKGPWYNAKGVKVADSVADLHSESNKLNKENSLTEYGEIVNGRDDTPNMHDMLTGSTKDGTAFAAGEDHTCSNWTGDGDGSAEVGHHDRQGGGHDPTSWNSAHGSKGCGQEDLEGTGGYGLFYCFARD